MFKFKILLIFCQILPLIICVGQKKNNKPNDLKIESTYECAGIYWQAEEEGAAKIRYKEVSENSWRQGLDLVYDSRDNEYRGSIISLSPNTEYEVEVSTSSAKSKSTFKTRNDNFPIGKTTVLPKGESDETVVITESGTPDAYHLITVPENSKSVLNLKNVSDYGIEIDADYVIIRGIEIRNAAIHGIRIKETDITLLLKIAILAFGVE
jgi:hypothetical protein